MGVRAPHAGKRVINLSTTPEASRSSSRRYGALGSVRALRPGGTTSIRRMRERTIEAARGGRAETSRDSMLCPSRNGGFV